MDASDMRLAVDPIISQDQLWDFYVRNDICETGYGDKRIAAIPLEHSSVIVGAFAGEKLVGILRALTDRSQAFIAEFCLDLTLQRENEHGNGSLIQSDPHGVAKAMYALMHAELQKLGVDFITAYIVEGIEESVYQGVGLVENEGHKVYVWDDRPYVKGEKLKQEE